MSLSAPARGLEPYLVKDINPVPAVTGSGPSNFVSLGNAGDVAVFTAFDGESFGLWRSDGTAAGTWRLAEICPVGSSGCGFAVVLAVVDGRCFLGLGNGIWATDGTAAGTLLLTDDLSSASPAATWVPEQRVLYFAGTDIAHGQELWRTDGTPAGTYRVIDLEPGPKPALPWSLTAFRGRVWFAAKTAAQGGAIWRSDGTERGTVPVYRTGRQVVPVIRGIVGTRLLFTEPFGRDGHRLWSSDGTARGTQLLVRLPHHIWDAVVQNGRLFFVSANGGRGQELWVSDGTVRGTRVLTDLPDKSAFFDNAGTYALYLPRTSLPGRLFFRVEDPARGVELWVSDGTPAGTRLVRDVCPGPCPGVDGILMSSQGLFYFAGSDGTGGAELWATDGTAAGTRKVREICPGDCGSHPDFPARFAGRLLFAAQDGANGRELWSTDGTAAGTVRLTDLASPDPELSFGPGAVVAAGAGRRYLFAAADGDAGSELWATDGTADGTALVADINQADFGGSEVSGIRALRDQAVFFADDGLHGYELWKSDGTAAGTGLVADLVPGPEPSYLPPAVLSSAEAGGKLYLLLFSDGFSLWRTDGTAAGTLLLRDSSAGPVPWSGSDLHAVGGTVFFTLYDGDLGTRLWATDGTVAGTRPVAEGAFSNPLGLMEMGGRLYFFAAAPDGVFGLWSSDGTAAGTVNVKRFGSDFGALPLPTVYAGRLWFFATAAPGDPRLWSSDGTEAGTGVVPLPGPLRVSFMASIGGALMISGYVEGSGFELWATDGTPEGTRKVGPAVDALSGLERWTVFRGRLVYGVDEGFDSHPVLWTSDGTAAGTGRLLDRDGQPIPLPLGFAVLGDRLIFTTAIPAQVWESDGTPAGTKPIARLRPIGLSSGAVGRAGGRVFFGAWEPATGQELWAVEP